ncbi:30S ribosomal protein S2 [Myxococcota bacterium]|nr:30S ribosomal protein S2 [Myxococcota bacterium]
MSENTVEAPGAETTTDAEAAAALATAGAEAEAASETPSETGAQLEQTQLTVRELLEAGVHFGHQTRRWNPQMRSFLFGERNGVHIIDLDQTLPRFDEALDFIREVTAGGGKVLFVGTKRQAQAPVMLEAQRAGQYYVNNRWLGGMLTNFKTVRKSIERFNSMLETVADEEKTSAMSKKDLSRVNRQIEKYRKSLDGMREMTRLPDAMLVIDVNVESIAISEAQRLGIPIIAVVDSNCDPRGIEFVVPGNDDSIRAIQLYCSRVASACLEGDAAHNERIQSEVAQDEASRAGSGPAPTGTGRVVVEISQPPRRGRGASFGEGADERATEPLKPHEVNPRRAAATTVADAAEAAAEEASESTAAAESEQSEAAPEEAPKETESDA